MWRHVWVVSAVILTCGKWGPIISAELFHLFLHRTGSQSVKVERHCVPDANCGLVLKEGIFAVHSALISMPEQLLLDTRGWSPGDGPTTFYSYKCTREKSREERLKNRKTEPDDSLSSRLCHYSTRPGNQESYLVMFLVEQHPERVVLQS